MLTQVVLMVYTDSGLQLYNNSLIFFEFESTDRDVIYNVDDLNGLIVV